MSLVHSPTVNDMFSGWPENLGFFSTLSRMSGVTLPWVGYADSISLDMQYHGNHSGQKLAAPLLLAMHGRPTPGGSWELTGEQRQKLAKTVWDLYNENWSRLWATMLEEYEPIENYRMVEERDLHGTDTGTVGTVDKVQTATSMSSDTTTKDSGTHTTTTSLTHGESVSTHKEDVTTVIPNTTETGTESKSGSDSVKSDTTVDSSATDTPGVTETQHGVNSAETSSGIHGFNADYWVPSDLSKGDNDATTVTTREGSDTRKGSETTDGTQKTTYDTTITTSLQRTGTEQTSANGDETITHSGVDTTKDSGSDSRDGTTKVVSDGGSGSDSTSTRTDDLARTEHETLKRSGNIGVTTSQQMLQSERDLWLWKFFDVVFSQVDTVLTLDVY